MILAGDIGGTKTNLALFRVEGETLELLHLKEFASKKYTAFSDILEEFLDSCGEIHLQGIALGVAGAVVDGVCATTNLPWLLHQSEIAQQSGCKNVLLLNDLEAAAFGMLYLDETAFIELTPQNRLKDATRAVIAAGTGLGEAILYYDGVAFHPLATEGGHCDFAAQTPLEDALLIWLRRRYGAHVSYERIVCGDGISTLYEFLEQHHFGSDSLALFTLEEGEDKNAIIVSRALGGDRFCKEVMRLFVRIYGAEAGNLALKSLSRGGVYIAGGIAPKIAPFLEDGVFVEAFCAKGRFEPLLREMAIKISTDPLAPLKGAAYFALTKFVKMC